MVRGLRTRETDVLALINDCSDYQCVPVPCHTPDFPCEQDGVVVTVEHARCLGGAALFSVPDARIHMDSVAVNHIIALLA